MADDPGVSKNLVEQLQRMQEAVLKAQKELAQATVTETAGGGAVKVTLTGDQRCTELVIDPQSLAGGDAEMLQDLVMTAFNNALEASRKLALDRLGPFSAGVGS